MVEPRRTQPILIVAIPALALCSLAAQPVALHPAVPTDATEAILEAFKRHSVVALGEGPHGNEQGHVFRLALVRDPRFVAIVNDIVVEFGSARYQATMDRFLQGEHVPRDDLKRVWQDTTASGPVWDRPIYQEFFYAVRRVNQSLPRPRQLRVLLGDAPIDWSQVRSHAELREWGMRKDSHASEVIKREVLAKGRRALVIFGDGHLQGRAMSSREARKLGLTNNLEAGHEATKMFIISSSFTDLSRWQADVRTWTVPSIAAIADTPIGRRPFASFYPIPPSPGWNTTRLQDHFDAVLYLGAPSAMSQSRLPPALCHDLEYMKMRLARMAVEDIRIRQAMIDGLKRYCEAQ